jgi:hypothetical protein
MQIEGSCHCGRVRFRAHTRTPYPYARCYCSICRKTAGGGGYAINIMAEADSLEVDGKENLSVYQALIEDEDNPGERRQSPGRRHFCKHCGSALWVQDPRWEQWIYPFASAVDTPLPTPPEHTHIMLDFRAPWCEPHIQDNDKQFPRYPEEAIVDWHQRLGLLQDD